MMKTFTLVVKILTLCFLVLIKINQAQAQCPPTGFEEPGNTCAEAPILCDDIDGYCTTVNNNNVQQPFPGCPWNVLNNDEWFAFFAGTTSISIEITPSSCNTGPNMGLQGGIYGQCISQIMDLQCSCTQNPFVLNSNNFVVGNIYYLVIDGCAGNVCDYSVAVLVGSTVPFPPENPGPISGPDTVCVNSSTSYSIAPPNYATIYTWEMDPELGTITSNTNNANVSWGATAGTTQLCVTVANGCLVNSLPSCTTIVVDPSPTATLSGSGLLCKEAEDTVFLSVSFTGVGPWTFVYTLGGAAQPPITTSTNPYQLAITGGGSVGLQSVTSGNADCPGIVSGTVTIEEIDLLFQAQTTASTCGQSNGDINLSVNGGQGPYIFNWSNGATTEDLDDVVGGSYTVTVSDANGCSETFDVTLDDDPITIDISGSVTANTTCNGGDGSVDIDVTPAGNNYTYNWSNGATTEDLDDVPAGTYTVTVSLGTSCSATASFTVPDEPNTPSITSSTTPSLCELANGDIDITVSGGVSPYTFNWSNGATTEDLDDVTAGSYTVTVTGANGCTETQTIALTNNNPPINLQGQVSANTTCIGGNGSIILNINPSSPPTGANYTITWSNGGNGTNLTNLTPGTYTVTVDGGGACTQTASYTIPDEPNTPNISATTTPSICELSNGDINITVSGGVAPYTFNWSNGATTEDLNDVLAGSYTVTVTGANGCTQTQTISLTNNNPPITISPTVTANTTCIGGNGSISISISPSNPPVGGNYTITWSNGATGTNLTDLTPGTYTVTVDGGGTCTQTASITVPDQPNTPNIASTVSPAYCGLSNGGVSINVTGGVSPYTYLWSNGATTPNISALPSGSYSLTVTGANGCTTTANFSVPNNTIPINITASVIANTTCSGSNGSISITVTPNPPPTGSYTYTWSNGGNGTNLTNLPPGSYTVTVSAGGTCTQTATFTVPDQPNQPSLAPSFTAATCGQSNGSASVSASGGVPPYSYNWTTGGNANSISNVPAGTYTVTVTGSNGCTSTASITIPDQPVIFTVSNNITPNTACNGTNGGIVLSITPPSPPNGNYTYNWSTGATTPSVSNLAPGSYTVTVSAGGSCTQVLNYTVPQNAILPTFNTSVTPGYCGLPTGGINLSITAGLPPFTYQWSNGFISEDLNNVVPGPYTVTVSGQVGCTTVSTINIPDNTINFTVSGIATGNTSCVVPNGQIVLTLTPPTPPQGPGYTYTWNNGGNTFFQTNLAPGNYTVTVSAGGTCTQVLTYSVFDFAFPPQIATSAQAATCGSSNGVANITVSGGESPYSYLWSNGANTEDLNGVTAGTYAVTVTANNGCTATASLAVANNNVSINISGSPSANTSCTAGNGAINITPSPAGLNYTFIWSNAATTEDISGLNAGSYTVTVTSGVACSATATYTVANNTANPQLSAGLTAAICGESNGAIDLSVSGSASPYTYAWDNGETTEDISALAPGNYSVVVTDASGCSSSQTFNVANNSSTFSLAGIPSPLSSCAADNGGVDMEVTPPGTYEFEWSNGATTEDIAGLPAGTYTVTITDGGAGGCSAEASFIVADERTWPELSQAVEDAQCGLANGAIDLSVSGGETPYLFDWSNGAGSEDLTGVFSGTYSVVVTGANGCTSGTQVTIPEITISLGIDGATTANTSCAVNTGAVDISVTPGGNYVYSWSNGETTEDINGVAGGAYSVTVSAGGTCTAEASFNVPTTTAEPILSQLITPSICGVDNGAIDLSVSNGVEPYIFEWASGQSSEDLTDVFAGSYEVTVTGSNGCSATAIYNLPNNNTNISIAGTATPNTLCNGGNGDIDISVTPPPALGYSFEWSTAATTEDLNNLPQGNYTVTVTEGNSCTAEASFAVANNTTAPDLSVQPAAAFCGLATGSVELSINGGAAPFDIEWSSGQTSEDLSDLLPGVYEVTVSGSDGCMSTAAATVANDILNIQLSAQVLPNTICNAGNGSLELSIAPAGTYSLLWDTDDTTSQLADLLPGTYSVTVSTGDGVSCTVTATYTVDDNSTAPQLSGSATQVLCFGEATGAIDLNIAGGTPPFTIQWSPAIAGNPEDPAGLVAGSYTAVVNDDANCTTSTSFDIGEPASAVGATCGATTTVSFPGLSDGAGSVNISGGTPPYSVSWTPGGSQANVPAGTFNLDNLAEGDYSVLVADANGCEAICDFSIVVEACLTLVGTMSGTLVAICGDGCITADYDDANQVLEPDDLLQFVLHTGSGSTIVGELARNTEPVFCFDAATMILGTTYYISAIAGNDDGSGNVDLSDDCSKVSAPTPIRFKPVPEAAIEPPANLNCLANQVSLTGSSNLPGASYAWFTSDGLLLGNTTNATATAAAAGTYFVILSVDGCTDTAYVQVDDISTIIQAFIDVDPSEILNCVVEAVTLTGSASGAAYPTYTWLFHENVLSQQNPIVIDYSGVFNLLVFDTVNFCSDTAVVEIIDGEIYPPLQTDPPPALTCTQTVVTLSGSSPAPGVELSWAIVSGTDTIIVGNGPSVDVTEPGTYYLIGTDPQNSCTNIASLTVPTNFATPLADAGTPFIIGCFGGEADLDGTGSQGIGPVSYLWSTSDGVILNGANTATPTVGGPGTYLLTVTNLGNGCTSTDSVEAIADEPVVDPEVFQPPCADDLGTLHLGYVSGGKPPYLFSYDGGQTFTSQSIFPGLAAGTYDVVVQDALGCLFETQATVDETPVLDLQLDTYVEVELGESYQINTQVTVPVSELASIAWTPGLYLSCTDCIDPVATPETTTLYVLTVTTQSGCEASDEILLLVTKGKGVYVPSAFSPNGDGVNDKLIVFSNPAKVNRVKSFLVFSRWGETVWEYYDFEPNNPAYGWDGTHRGQFMNPAVFAWFAVVEFADGTEQLFEGDVSLMR